MTKEMPTYVSHKKVRALEIRAIGSYSTDSTGNLQREIIFGDPGFDPIHVPGEMFTRYVPMPGDYYVVYEDGYQSFSPRKAFLDGYALAHGENVLMERLNDLAMAGPGVAPMWLQGGGWAKAIARVAREAYVTINSLKQHVERLQSIIRRCTPGADVVDIGGEAVALHLRKEENEKADPDQS
jgi:hypothetical protein